MEITLKNIKKEFNDRLILNDISHTFSSGEISVIVGESGSGKTTLLNIIALFAGPSSGEVFFNEKNVTLLKSSSKIKFIRKNIGYIYQDIRIFEDLTVYDNLKLGLLFSVHKFKNYSDKIFKILNLLKMDGMENQKAGLLSGGEKQRLAIGRALISGKKIILADEPTGSLDEENTVNILNLLKNINSNYGTTILIITHSELVSNFFNNTFELKNGNLDEK